MYIMNNIAKKIRATDVRNNFAATIKEAKDGPIEITNRNGDSSYIVSADDFKWMQLAEKLEDHMLGKMAEEAEKS